MSPFLLHTEQVYSFSMLSAKRILKLRAYKIWAIWPALVVLKRERDYAGFLKNVFPFAWHTRMQSSSMHFLISSSVSAITGIHVMFCSS